MKSTSDYNLIDCSEMGIADYLKNTRLNVPRWMNQNEAAAYKIGFERAREQCKLPPTIKK